MMFADDPTQANDAGPEDGVTRLPVAQLKRWQPTRGGLLNLYRYDSEEFRYEQGHLLLRGNNGTGKSRVLALQLPFLLDGDIASHRVEPDGDPAKRMEWNLLMNRHKDRLGYTWLEFGRLQEDGSEQYLTIGCGLSAVAGRGVADKWFFITKQRIGCDLYLQSTAGAALGRAALVDAIGEHGHVYTAASAYRAAVDRALFGLGEQRYAALVDLLIQLRKPQLSRQLDERQLSDALSQALRPLPESVLADVAESFRSLEADRGELERYRVAEGSVASFLEEYARYSRIAARRRAEVVRRAHSAYEDVQRDLRATQEQLEAATRRRAELDAQLLQLGHDESAALAEERALQQSPEMRGAENLDRLRGTSQAHTDAAQKAAHELERSRATVIRARDEHESAVYQHRDADESLSRSAAEARTAAVTLGVELDHDRALGRDLREPHERKHGEAATQTIIERRRAAATHLRERSREVDRARQTHERASLDHQHVAGQLDEARESERAAHAQAESQREALGLAYGDWFRGLEELAPIASPTVEVDSSNVEWTPDDVEVALESWCESANGDSPVGVAIRALQRPAFARLAGERAAVEARRSAHDLVVRGLRDEQASLSQGVHQPPSPPPTRDPAARLGRPGAPLWRLCDFRPEIADPVRAGVEAALEAAGLLDAWITPDGRVLDAGSSDTLLLPDTSARAGEFHLGTLLVPAIDPTDPAVALLTDPVIEALLRHIGARQGAGTAWVDGSGRWQLGPLHGSHMKTVAEHLGGGAREAARKRRLAALAEELQAALNELERLSAELREIDRRTARADAEVRRAPGDAELRRCLAERFAAVTRVAALRVRVTDAERRMLECKERLLHAERVRLEAARDLGVERWVDRLEDLDAAIANYKGAIGPLWLHARDQARALDAAERTRRNLLEAEETATRRAEDWNAKETLSRATASELQTLESVLGAAIRDVLSRLDAARARLAAIHADATGAQKEAGKAHDLTIQSEAVRVHLLQSLEGHTSARAAAISRLARLSQSGLLTVAGDESDDDAAGWSVTRAVEVARRVESRLSAVQSDELAWDKAQGGIHKHVQLLSESLIEHGYPPDVTQEDDLLVVRITFQGQILLMPRLRDALSGEVATRQSVLDAREREVIENHLLGEVAAHLHDLLHEAAERVDGINAEIERLPTSTGMTLRFIWEPVDDGPAGFSDVRARLLRSAGTWSPAERQKVGEFLQRQIKAVRAADDTSTWQEQLVRGLDYRAWHRFAVERQQEGRWVRLTRRTHGTGSSGEKAIALTIPQFAAAAATYAGASPLAPRLILLDEAFVGIDSDMRRKCMGLLAAFDLDFVMTSEREWCCYDTLPGVAISQLSTRPNVDAVAVTRWIWNGRQRIRDDAPLPPAAPARGAT